MVSFTLTAAAALLYGSVRAGFILGNHYGVPGANATYDYVVVGGGSAGLIMATRLAESGKYTVAVIEAGGQYDVDNGNVSVVPGLGRAYDVSLESTVNNFPQVDWQFLTEPQTGFTGQRAHYVRGKTLGGSSALNNLVYQRATTQSYQQWADMVGDQSYTFKNLLPYFWKSSTYTGDGPKRPKNASTPAPSPNAYKNVGSPLQVSMINYPLPINSWIKLAYNELGLPVVNDFSSGTLIGHQYTPNEVNPVDATRSSTYSSYLQDAIKNRGTNLKTYVRSLATKILFDANKNANAVVVKSYGNEYILSANKEVIVSAGAFQSPQLLMVSGIGPSATLRRFGIPVLADKPGVGQNMADHVLYNVLYPVNVQGIGLIQNNATAAAIASDMFVKNQTGVLCNPAFDYIGWEKVPQALRRNFSAETKQQLSAYPADWPEVEYVTGDSGSQAGYQFTAVLSPTLVAPISRGNVTIRSASMEDHPVINPNWLQAKADQEVAVAAFKRVRQILNTTALKPVKIGSEQPTPQQVSTDEQILGFIRQTGSTLYHAASTCAMGKANDPMAVLDPQARVRGVGRLRVVDASSFPSLPPGHPTATIYALAEKIAAAILAGY